MKTVHVLFTAVLVLVFTVVHADPLGIERDAKQAELDAACEEARQKKIALERAKHIEECVATGMLADRETCERFYADYGESAAGRAPLYYDLPECEKAHEYRNSYRSSDT